MTVVEAYTAQSSEQAIEIGDARLIVQAPDMSRDVMNQILNDYVATSKNPDIALQRVTLFYEYAYGGDVSAASIAQRFGISRVTIGRAIKEIVGVLRGNVETHPDSAALVVNLPIADENYNPDYIAASYQDLSWQDSSLCAETDPDAFVPEHGKPTISAKRVCALCEVAQKCLQYAIDTRQDEGLWGGLSTAERAQLGVNPSGETIDQAIQKMREKYA